MPHKQYKTFTQVWVDGTDEYVANTEEVLRQIEINSEGWALLSTVAAGRHRVTIRMVQPGKGNACSPDVMVQGIPLMAKALTESNATAFASEVACCLNVAKQRGITLEHIARQLTMGLTPVTYVGASNVVRPRSSVTIGQRATPVEISRTTDQAIMRSMYMLSDIASGALALAQMPAQWKIDLPRVLRNHLTPGRGCASTVNFDPLNELPCHLDPAMRKRPPAFGLAHEMIHSLHCQRGQIMLVKNTDGQLLEEVITVGLPPYNFEEFSDNKLRSLWNVKSLLRSRY